jgi:hypothetical protein
VHLNKLWPARAIIVSKFLRLKVNKAALSNIFLSGKNMILVFSKYSPATTSSLCLFLGSYILFATLYTKILNLCSSLACSTEFSTHNSSYNYNRYALTLFDLHPLQQRQQKRPAGKVTYLDSKSGVLGSSLSWTQTRVIKAPRGFLNPSK